MRKIGRFENHLTKRNGMIWNTKEKKKIWNTKRKKKKKRNTDKVRRI